jgi:hypothetical protein
MLFSISSFFKEIHSAYALDESEHETRASAIKIANEALRTFKIPITLECDTAYTTLWILLR